MINAKICAVIVSYNRKELLLRCIQHCIEQSVKLSILIFDNHSSDGTEDYLRQNGLLDNPMIIYYYSDVNVGGAGGFSKGLYMAYSRGFDFVWLMDDDGYPRGVDCLFNALKLCTELGRDKVIVNALVTAEDNNELSFSTGGFMTKKDVISKCGNKILPDKVSPFNGTLISKEVINIIGYPRSDFFIKGDETEYVCRAKSKGIELVTSIRSDFYHPKMQSKSVNILFLKINNGEESYWKEYYRARNYVYIYKTYFGKWALIKHIIRCHIKCCLYQEDRCIKRRYTLKGLKDGLDNRFENIEIG